MSSLLQKFPAETSLLLIEFSKYLATLDADYIILMARKALRLYDFLVLAGGKLAQKPVLSDHVLDQNPEIFRGKKVCLVDDTLILGTTLGEAKRRLIEAGAKKVTSHVFICDKENWCRDLIIPEKIFALRDHEQVRSFCAQEVAALAAAGIPYLSDFPLSVPVRFTSATLPTIHSLMGWETHTLTNPSQERGGVSVYSLLPKRETFDQGKATFGRTLGDLLEITKIRAFGVRAGSNYWLKFIPIVTLRPIRSTDVDTLFDRVLVRLEGESAGCLSKLRNTLSSSLSRLRFLQYTLSLAMGQACLAEIFELAANKNPIRFDLSEAVRLFGPWLRSELQSVHAAIPLAFGSDSYSRERDHIPSMLVNLPEDVVRISKDEFKEFVHGAGGSTTPQLARSRLTDLIQAFVGLYRKHEPAARLEAHKLGETLFDAPPEVAPHRDRLKFGFVWRALVECLLEGEARPNLRRANMLSLVLDQLVDMGIAVPILCDRGGVLFRAYRYGEDVEFGDQELALAHEVIVGFTEGAEEKDVGRVTLEKLLASLLHVGVSRGYLSVVHGMTGAEGIARVGFHLHGAVPIFPKHDTVFADEQDSWLSQYLLDRGVLERPPGARSKYVVGQKPEAAFPNVGALGQAHQLGWLLGLLHKSRKGTAPVLSENDLIVLASCIQPRHVASAVAAEARILAAWFDRSSRRFRKLPLSISDDHIRGLRAELINNSGYLGMNSARLKLSAHWTDRPASVINECASYLASLPTGGSFMSSHWRADWLPILMSVSEEQRSRIEPRIEALAKAIYSTSIGIFTIELALHSLRPTGRLEQQRAKEFERVCKKIESFLGTFAAHCSVRKEEQATLERLQLVLASQRPMEDPVRALDYGVEWVHARLAGLRALASQTEEVVKDFGRTDRRISYPYLFWYDIIDSRGKKSGLANEALDAYRDRVRAFKGTINRDFYGLLRDSRRSGGIVYPWQGPIGSKDDEKHVFITGSASLTLLQEAIRILLGRADTHRVCVRCVIIRTDFAGGHAHRYETQPQVEGETFWEHLSEFKKRLKDMDARSGLNKKGSPATRSFLWVAGDLLDSCDTSDIAPQKFNKIIRTEVQSVQVMTQVSGGPVINFSRRS